MRNPPLIGVTCSHTWSAPLNSPYLGLLPTYTRAIEMAGGVPVIVPVTLNLEGLEAIYARLDGVLLPGGADVSAAAYGAERHPTMYGEDEARDAAEIALSRWAVRDDKPLLAICRGIQVLNVALGGTLYRHIPDEYPTAIEHDHEYATQRVYLAHEIEVEPGSRLWDALGAAQTPVNSLHHQAANRVGEGLRVVARAADGLIEALEHRERRYVVGVQWHPEVLVDHDPAMRRLFQSFVQAADGREGGRESR